MYRRYYQRYDNFGNELDEPLKQNTEDYYDNNVQEEDVSNNDIDKVNISASPEIIIPESPFDKNEIEEQEEQIDEQPKQLKSDINTYSEATIDRSKPILFGKFRIDDLLLLALIVILLLEGVQDPLIIIMLAFLFFIGF